MHVTRGHGGGIPSHFTEAPTRRWCRPRNERRKAAMRWRRVDGGEVDEISSCVEELNDEVKSTSLFYVYMIILVILDEAFS